MSLFNLHDSTEQEIELERTKDDPNAPKEVGFFDRAWTGTYTGFMSGGAKLAKTATLAGATVPVGIDALFGTDLQTGYFENVVDGIANNAVDYWRPAPEVGTLGQMIHGVGEIAIPLMSGGGASALAISHGANTSAELLEQGASLAEAELVGGVQGVGMAAGAKTPAAFGNSLPTRLITGAGVNAGTGVVMNASSSEILKQGGHDELAQRYELSVESGAADVAMGAAFGGFAHMTKAEVDVRSNKIANETYQNKTNAVKPKDIEAESNHVDNMNLALEALTEGKPIDWNKLKPVEGEVRPFAYQTPIQPRLTAYRAEMAFKKDINHSVLKTGVANDIYTAAKNTGLKGDEALLIASIETGGKFNLDAKNPDSSAHGVFQVTDGTWKYLGGKDRNNKAEQIRIGLKNIEQTKKQLTKSLGREIKPHELYMGHMLGAEGARQVLTADKNTPLIDVVRRFSKKNADSIVKDNGMEGMTVGQATNKWKNKADYHASKINSGRIGRAIESGHVPFGNVGVNVAKYSKMDYVWGGKGKNNGVDCSGFIYNVWKDNGLDIPYMTTEQLYYKSGSGHYNEVDTNNVRPGDVIVFRYKGDKGEVGHTGIVESVDPATGKVRYYGSQRRNGKGKKSGPEYATYEMAAGKKFKFLRPKGVEGADGADGSFLDKSNMFDSDNAHAAIELSKSNIAPVDPWVDVDASAYANVHRFGFSNDMLTAVVAETTGGVDISNKPFVIDYQTIVKTESPTAHKTESISKLVEADVNEIPNIVNEPDSIAHVKLNDTTDEITFYKTVGDQQYKAVAQVDNNQLKVTSLEKQATLLPQQGIEKYNPPPRAQQPRAEINNPTIEHTNNSGVPTERAQNGAQPHDTQHRPLEPRQAFEQTEAAQKVKGEEVVNDQVEALREFIKDNPDFENMEVKTGIDADGQERSGTLSDILNDIDQERVTGIRESESIVKAALCSLMGGV